MDFRFGGENDTFASEVRAFLDRELTTERTRTHSDPDDLSGLAEPFERALHHAAGEHGYLSTAMPVTDRARFNFLVAAFDAPLIDTAVTLAGYSITTFASEAQRAFFLPRIESGEIEMCIAYTEEHAGSDLGAQSATAVLDADGDGFVLSGRKVLVTGAHKADWCLTTARTRVDGPVRDGLSMFLVDMKLPGIEVVRRPTMNTWTLDEIVFDGVRLGPGALLGEARRRLATAHHHRRGGTVGDVLPGLGPTRARRTGPVRHDHRARRAPSRRRSPRARPRGPPRARACRRSAARQAHAVGHRDRRARTRAPPDGEGLRHRAAPTPCPGRHRDRRPRRARCTHRCSPIRRHTPPRADASRGSTSSACTAPSAAAPTRCNATRSRSSASVSRGRVADGPHAARARAVARARDELAHRSRRARRGARSCGRAVALSQWLRAQRAGAALRRRARSSRHARTR